MKSFQITEYCHDLVSRYSGEPEFCIDATMGNGEDTLFLCKLVGASGRVIGFDIQPTAIENTKKLLKTKEVSVSARLILDSHANMDTYVEQDRADVIMFNFGYLPGGDHGLSTKAVSSIAAIEKGLNILKKGGIMTLCIYSGGDSGYEEKNAIMDFIAKLNPKKYIVIIHEFYNRPNDPPVPVLIKKIR